MIYDTSSCFTISVSFCTVKRQLLVVSSKWREFGYSHRVPTSSDLSTAPSPRGSVLPNLWIKGEVCYATRFLVKALMYYISGGDEDSIIIVINNTILTTATLCFPDTRMYKLFLVSSPFTTGISYAFSSRLSVWATRSFIVLYMNAHALLKDPDYF